VQFSEGDGLVFEKYDLRTQMTPPPGRPQGARTGFAVPLANSANVGA
jgi:hypothetical protein